MMKKNVIAASVLLSTLSMTAYAEEVVTPPPAASAGHGVVKFVGAIIDAPCSISPDSLDQTVEMGQIATTLLESKGETPVRPFEIRLEGCSLATATSATVTFNGIPSDTAKKHLQISGTAKGAAIAMVNQVNGADITLGTPTDAVALTQGDKRLKFGAKVVSNVADGGKAVPGDFTATTDFIMTYL